VTFGLVWLDVMIEEVLVCVWVWFVFFLWGVCCLSCNAFHLIAKRRMACLIPYIRKGDYDSVEQLLRTRNLSPFELNEHVPQGELCRIHSLAMMW
jgi:hypothetical protein